MIRITMHVLGEKRKEVLQTLLSIIESTGREEGCLNYHVFMDIANRNVFSLLGEWKTHEDLDHHIKSDRFGVMLGTRSLLREPPSFQIHTISNSDGMERIQTLRGKRTQNASI